MKPYLLLPRIFRPIGFVLLLPGLVLGYMVEIQGTALEVLSYGNKYEKSLGSGANYHNLSDEVAATLIILGFFFICFSRLKNEDSLTGRCRLDALYCAVLVDFVIISILIIVSVADSFLNMPLLKKIDFLAFLLLYNVFFILFLFTFRFYYLLKRDHKNERERVLYHLPNRPFKIIGVIGFIVFVLLATASIIGLDVSDDVTMALSPCILVLLWSREKNEDEFIHDLKINSMKMAVYINYAALLTVTWILYGGDYFYIYYYAGIFAIPVIYIIIFQSRLMLYKKKMLNRNSDTDLFFGK